ncbi:MAG: hypothetical protein RXO24_10595 [Acidilobus sp.]
MRSVFCRRQQGCGEDDPLLPARARKEHKEILRIVKSLQLIDRTDAVVPANWPRNETVKDGLLLPAPTSREEARLRLAQFKGYVSCLPSGRRPKRTLRRP